MIIDFNLPTRTIVNKTVPKNAFDHIATAKQRKLFSTYIDRIVWQNKLSAETINLTGNAVQEIQVFQLVLRKKENIAELLAVIDKAIPYPILFSVTYDEEYFLSLSSKRPNLNGTQMSVIDWTFVTSWRNLNDQPYGFALRRNLDFILLDFCLQLSSTDHRFESIQELCSYEQKRKELELKVSKLTSIINRAVYFKEKVQLNIELQAVKKELEMHLKK